MHFVQLLEARDVVRINTMPTLAPEMPFLNTCRWISAALVAYGHIFLLVYPAFTLHESAVGAALVAAAKLRYLAVSVFFVVSGYLVGGGILANFKKAL